MARSIEYSRGGLAKRQTKTDWRWVAQVKWRYVGETKWRTKEKWLKDDSGKPITTNARNIDPKTGKDRNSRNVRAAMAAYEKWFGSLSTVERATKTSVHNYLVMRIDTLARQADAARKNKNNVPHTNSTLRGYREYIPIISDGFEGITIAALDSRDVYRWIESMKESGMAASTMRKAFSILSTTCDYAVGVGDMESNPCTKEIRNTIPRSPLAEPNALSPLDIMRVNELLDDAQNDRLRVGARLALVCGLRAGEVCALRWCDVDADVLHVRESIENAGGGTKAKAPKSFAGTRDITLPRPLALEIAAWRQVQQEEWTTLADEQEDEITPFSECRVIGYADGTWYTPNSLGHLWNRLAKGMHDRDPKDRRKPGTGWVEGREPIIGMNGEQIRLHDLRHTFATYHIATGTNVARTAMLMGHGDGAVTMRRYVGRLKDAAIVAQISGKSAEDVLTAGTSWADVVDDGERPDTEVD